MKDPYQTLGISSEASDEEIKKAYKELAMKWHPDRNQGDKGAENRFKEINEAYQILKDGKYNPFLHGPGANPGGNPFIDFDEMFKRHFNDGGTGSAWGFSSRPHMRVNRTAIHISIEEAHRGVQKKIQINETNVCIKCKGVGFKFTNDKCAGCGGSGQIRRAMGAIHIATSCQHCRGFGHKMDSPCTECGGKGKKIDTQELKITIPAGIMIGQSIRPRPNLEIVIDYAPHPKFRPLNKRTGQIGSEIDVNMFDAMFGNNLDVDTLNGIKKLKINPGTQPGTILRIKNGGIGNRADHLIVVNVQLPTNLTDEQNELLKKLQVSMGENNG